MTDTLRNLFTWRTAIIHSDLPPTTRHVLLTLSLHMNEVGGSCFPSTKTLAKETGLSERAICTHLASAQESSWLKKQSRKTGNQWKSTEYFAAIPAKFIETSGTERGSALPVSGTERGSVRGTEPDDTLVLNEVQSNSTVNSTDINSTAPPPSEDLFEEKPKGVHSIDTYLRYCKRNGLKAIPPDDPVFKYAEGINMPMEILYLCWMEFVDRMRDRKKKYRSWPRAFQNCVRDNWFGLWFIGDSGFALTTKGKQAENLHKNRATA